MLKHQNSKTCADLRQIEDPWKKDAPDRVEFIQKWAMKDMSPPIPEEELDRRAKEQANDFYSKYQKTPSGSEFSTLVKNLKEGYKSDWHKELCEKVCLRTQYFEHELYLANREKDERKQNSLKNI